MNLSGCMCRILPKNLSVETESRFSKQYFNSYWFNFYTPMYLDENLHFNCSSLASAVIPSAFYVHFMLHPHDAILDRKSMLLWVEIFRTKRFMNKKKVSIIIRNLLIILFIQSTKIDCSPSVYASRISYTS